MILAHGLNRIIELRYLTNTIRFQSKILNKPLAYSDACYIALPMSWRLCLLAVLQPQWTFTTSSYCPCWANPKGRGCFKSLIQIQAEKQLLYFCYISIQYRGLY